MVSEYGSVLTSINGYTVVSYSEKTCKQFGLSHPCYAAFSPSSDDFSPSSEECSCDTLLDLSLWCSSH